MRKIKLKVPKKTPHYPSEDAMLAELMQLVQAGEIPISDVDAMLRSLKALDEQPYDPRTGKRDQAMQIAFDGQDAPTPQAALRLFRRALKLDPDCVDALAGVAEIESKTVPELIEGLKLAIAAGERSLGPDYFRKHKGEFWGLLDTRPYMRTREQLGHRLFAVSRTSEAIDHFKALLELNPEDNQGIREVLLTACLSIGDTQGAASVIDRYREDPSALFAWGRVFHCFLAGLPAGAILALKEARDAHPFVELYLSGIRKPPVHTPDRYVPGSEEEAMICAETLEVACKAQPAFVEWLQANA